MDDIDDVMRDDEEESTKGIKTKPSDKEVESLQHDNDESDKEQEEKHNESKTGRTFIGRVEKFFNKINVAAIRLEGDLRIGDRIEIESDDSSVIMTVTSMQMNKEDIASATSGDDIGIKLKMQVSEGDRVYLLS
ncbi:MAG: hypothetical protein ABR981_02215 [Candidatus Micrarchaeaceae archaeon]|jgi:putative protease